MTEADDAVPCVCSHGPDDHVKCLWDCLASIGPDIAGKPVFCGCRVFDVSLAVDRTREQRPVAYSPMPAAPSEKDGLNLENGRRDAPDH